MTVRVEIKPPGQPISPLIYGVAHGDPEDLVATGARLRRWGGNPNSRYNWRHGSAWNAARDWDFRNYGDATEKERQPSSAADDFVATNRAHQVETYLTIPALGWVAKNGDPGSRSIGVPRTGGAGGREGEIAGYDPANNRQATSLRSAASGRPPRAEASQGVEGVVYQDQWIAHLLQRFGTAAAGGVRYYAVDNEPDLWAETHTDVRPAWVGYDDLLDIFLEYAGAIKDVDATAQVAGPCLSGWLALFGSPRDLAARRTPAARIAHRLLPLGLATLAEPDRSAHGGEAFLPWWLSQVRRHDELAGRRTLDVLDVHFYPQAPGVFAGGAADATNTTTNALRLRSTRALWDTTYSDESWIGEPVRLLPRLRSWIDLRYPGTQLAIGEWNWGADTTVNGALAIADVLGIFGREGVDLAAYWTVPPRGSPGAFAFALYTNYDGRGAMFGDHSLPARSSTPDDVTVFASRDSRSGEVVLMAINKRPAATIETTFHLDGGQRQGRHLLYRYDQSEPSRIREIDGGTFEDGRIVVSLPPYSITVLRLLWD